MNKGYDNTILFAVTGTSPAVLTETVWALATERKAVIPHQIIVLTTTAGRKAIETELFKTGLWDNLITALKNKGFDIKDRLKFGLCANHVRLFPASDGKSDLSEALAKHTKKDLSRRNSTINNLPTTT